MIEIEWNKLSLNELKDIQKQAAKTIASFEDRKKKEALAALKTTAGEMGFSLNELVGFGNTVTQSTPKYAHPENANLTWSGRGRQPKWFKEAIASGQLADDLLIS